MNCKACNAEIAKDIIVCPECGIEQKSFFMKPQVITGVLVLMLLGVISIATGGNKGTVTSIKPTVAIPITKVVHATVAKAPIVKTPTALTVTSAPKVTVPVATPVWQKVIEFSGVPTKNTQPFKITSNKWRIVWSTTPTSMGDMNFIIGVNDATGSQVSSVANVIGTANNVSYMTGAGVYSLGIISAQNYDITIEQTK